MAIITKALTVLAVHGDTDEQLAQVILNEKSARDPEINPAGVMPGDPAKNLQGLRHDTTTWPKAECTCTVVLEGKEDSDPSRIDLEVYDFAQMVGVVAGATIKATFEIQ